MTTDEDEGMESEESGVHALLADIDAVDEGESRHKSMLTISKHEYS